MVGRRDSLPVNTSGTGCSRVQTAGALRGGRSDHVLLTWVEHWASGIRLGHVFQPGNEIHYALSGDHWAESLVLERCHRC
jgi:hypothetical protein